MHSIAFQLSLQRLALFISVVLSFKLASLFADGQASFTQEPPNNLYVLSGKNATFSWKYTVSNRESKFFPYSPKWSFYDENGTEHVIGNDYRFNNWNWQIVDSSCPQRLLKPTVRVFKKENATLVITNVTTADNGMYGCTLVLKSPPSPDPSKIQLIVTVKPQINITGKTEVMENTTLTLNCSAVGSPISNVTWLNAGVVLTQGIQSAVLTIANITREQAGTYHCFATNNPNEPSVQEVIAVNVLFPPELNRSHSSINVTACPNRKPTIVCAAVGYPNPTYYLYDPNNKSVGKNKTGVESGIQVTQIQGTWTCYITNGIGQGIYHKAKMEVLEESDPRCNPCLKKGFTTGDIVGMAFAGTVAAIIIVVIIVVVIYKTKIQKKAFTTKEKIVIAIGLTVAVVVIIVIIIVVAVQKEECD